MASQEVAKVIDELRSHPVIEQISGAPIPVEEARQSFEEFENMFPLGVDVSIEKISASGVPAEWVSTPNSLNGPVILFFHGGGYVIGSVNTHRELCSRISRSCHARVLNVDYRLAPENQFPAACEDAKKTYKWLLAEGTEPSNIVVCGDSAGGGLTIALLTALRDERTSMPAAGVCLSPWVDLECNGKEPPAKDPLITIEGLRELGRLYVGDASPHNPLASPIYADLKNLPPILIQVGTAEVLFDDAERLASRAEDVEVNVTLQRWEGLFHVFQLYPQLPEANEAVTKIGEFVTSTVNR